MRPEEDVHEIARSMGKLLELPAARLTLFTGLGNVVKDGRAALEGCIDYIRALSRKAKELEAEGFSIGEMVNRLFGRESILAGLTGGHISSENVVRALLRPEA